MGTYRCTHTCTVRVEDTYLTTIVSQGFVHIVVPQQTFHQLIDTTPPTAILTVHSDHDNTYPPTHATKHFDRKSSASFEQ